MDAWVAPLALAVAWGVPGFLLAHALLPRRALLAKAGLALPVGVAAVTLAAYALATATPLPLGPALVWGTSAAISGGAILALRLRKNPEKRQDV